MRGGVIIKGDH